MVMIFMIKKLGKDKWRLLQDLRKVNNVIEEFRSLQPGMPTPNMLPHHWPLAIIDIKNCFFHIPLHPHDAPCFSFSVPSLNCQAPLQHYHWLVLTQGMKNRLTICQWYVAEILSPIRQRFPDSFILHYMDNILVCAKDHTNLDRVLKETIRVIDSFGFEIWELSSPWTYLGLWLREQTVVLQQIIIKDAPKMLHDHQQLCGSINWVHPLLGIGVTPKADNIGLKCF